MNIKKGSIDALTATINLLKKDNRFISKDGILLKNQIQESAYKNDSYLIKELLSNKTTKQCFFFEIDKALIFDKEKFIDFISNKQFLPDSYTSFKNKIGLMVGKEYLSENKETVLVWPYKDCVLEGGMTKEDQGREEIFHNEILTPDDINTLLDEKVFTNFKRIDKNGEHELTEFKKDDCGNIKDNLIIKGNNLLAIASLKKDFANKIKLIYIDPPYNTGNDGFRYNDSFNHSTWLTFMKNRLDIAKDLLRDDGVIFVQCDDNEQAYLKVLMDEIFVGSFINCIVVKMNESKGLKNAHVDKRFPKNKEYLLVYAKNINSFRLIPKKIEKESEELEKYIRYYGKWIPNLEDDISKWKIENFPKENDIEEKLKHKDRLIYLVKPDNDIKVEVAEGKFIKIKNRKDVENIYYKKNGVILNVLFLEDNVARFLGDLWIDISTININKEGGEKTLSNGQKPERLIYRIIDMTTKTGDLVLDYHLGSGTTCAVAHKMGRRYIGIEQMDYIEDITLARLKNVINKDQSGISQSVNWEGGGDFVYMEMAEWNQEWINRIKNIKTTKEMIKIWNNITERAFLSYKVDPKMIDINAKDFNSLSIINQKRFLIECLDKNHLYVNFSDIDDKEYKISEKDKKLNKNFYGR